MTNQVAPGWHADPTDPNLMRYWDGIQWTAQTQPKPPPLTAQGPDVHPFDASIHTYRMVNNVMAALSVISLLLFVLLFFAESPLSWAFLVGCIAFLVIGFAAAQTANRMIKQAYGDEA